MVKLVLKLFCYFVVLFVSDACFTGEFNTGSFPRGLSLMLGMLSNWIYDRPPTASLTFNAPLQALKQRLQVFLSLDIYKRVYP